MDDSALKNLSIKALKSYLGHYNIPTAGMIEKSELIKAVKDNKPLPEASQVHFRQQLPNTPDKLVVFLDEFAKLGKTSATTSQPISSPDTLLQDLDLFFKKLTNLNLNGDQDEVPKTNPAVPPRPQPIPEPQPQSQPKQQQQQKDQPRPSQPQPQK
ncbi:hypothetical protein BGZ81_002375, partial [Podila clonocystis]